MINGKSFHLLSSEVIEKKLNFKIKIKIWMNSPM